MSGFWKAVGSAVGKKIFKPKVSETITSVKGKYNIKKKKKKSWKDYVDTSNPSYKKNWPPGE